MKHSQNPAALVVTEKTVYMRLEKETPGAVRYREINGYGEPRNTMDKDTVLATIYIRKSAMPRLFSESLPKMISVQMRVEHSAFGD